MIGDAFVFDGVAHPFNFEADNAYGQPGQMFSNHLYAFHATLTPDGEPVMSAEEFLHNWSIEEIREMVYNQSDTDMLVAMPLPLTDLYKDGLSPWEECAALARLDPDRTVFWGTVNPLEGKKAVDDVTRQVEEFGARAFKFYNVRYEDAGPVPWRMDDRKVAFPVFERIQELGVNLIGVHKGVPL
jgi:predicted TIM-barrel fold metal-dependent hydrolase